MKAPLFQAYLSLPGIILTKQELLEVPSLFLRRPTLGRWQTKSDFEVFAFLGCSRVRFGRSQIFVILVRLACGNSLFEQIQNFDCLQKRAFANFQKVASLELSGRLGRSLVDFYPVSLASVRSKGSCLEMPC